MEALRLGGGAEEEEVEVVVAEEEEEEGGGVEGRGEVEERGEVTEGRTEEFCFTLSWRRCRSGPDCDVNVDA